jgi:hypothetical protein
MYPNQTEVDAVQKEAYAVALMVHEEENRYTRSKTKVTHTFACHCFNPDLKEFAIIYWPNESMQRVERFDPPRVWAKTYLLDNLTFTKKPDDWNRRVFEFVDVKHCAIH